MGLLAYLSSFFFKPQTTDKAPSKTQTEENIMVEKRVHNLQDWVYTSVDKLSCFMVEFVGCMIFHFIGSVAPTAWANGIVLIVLVYYTAKISGAHLNPAVTLTFCILGHTKPIEVILYWCAQISGCAVGALWIAALVPGLYVRQKPIGVYEGISGCFTPTSALTKFQVYAWEAVCTTCFIVPIFSVVWYTQNKKGYGNTGPFIVGMSLLANALACGPFTGASLNPARTLGSPIVFDCPYQQNIWVYVLGELTGSIIASLAIIPFYGMSRTAWYVTYVPKWFFAITRTNQHSIVLETVKEMDKKPTRTGSIKLHKCHTQILETPSARYDLV